MCHSMAMPDTHCYLVTKNSQLYQWENSHTFKKEMQKGAYEFLRIQQNMEKYDPQARASCSPWLFLKFSKCL